MNAPAPSPLRRDNPEESWILFSQVHSRVQLQVLTEAPGFLVLPALPLPTLLRLLPESSPHTPPAPTMNCALELLSQGLLLGTVKLRRHWPGTTRIAACRSYSPAQAPGQAGSATDQGLGLLGFAPPCQAQAKLLRGAHKYPFSE